MYEDSHVESCVSVRSYRVLMIDDGVVSKKRTKERQKEA